MGNTPEIVYIRYYPQSVVQYHLAFDERETSDHKPYLRIPDMTYEEALVVVDNWESRHGSTDYELSPAQIVEKAAREIGDAVIRLAYEAVENTPLTGGKEE